MDINEAKQIVIDAGHKLVKEGLVARTWGNISCKVDKDTFVITPSGRSYEDLTLNDIVPVKIEDCSWEGTIKPSSEKGIHANVYKLRSDITAVIHTHQLNASVIAAARKAIPIVHKTDKLLFQGDIACANYGLPGTGPLKKATATALAQTGSKAAIMANHGAVCIGTTMDEAFDVSLELENICQEFIFEQFEKKTGKKVHSVEELHQAFLKEKGVEV